MATANDWSTADVDPRKILLDVLNPRIEVEPGTTQDQLRHKLLDLEDVLDLARGINKNEGLMFGERIITLKIGSVHTVLEGNRRVAACQMLLDPSLIPTAYRSRFPVVTAKTRARIAKVQCDVAPSREAAEPILTKRHTEQGPKPWSPVANMRRAVRLLGTHSNEQVAQTLGTTVAKVKKLVRPYRLLQYAWSLPGWTADEKKALLNEKLVTNPYTRFFTLKKTIEALKISFDSSENIVSTLPKSQFKTEMTRIARDFLLPDPSNFGKPRCNTRTDPAVYFESLLATAAPPPPASPGPAGGVRPTAGSVQPPTSATTGTPRGTQPRAPKASQFFENLTCKVVNDPLIKLTKELAEINASQRPIAASMLTRAMLETALLYKVRQAGKMPALMTANRAANPKAPPGADPGLDMIIGFCKNFSNGVFAEQNICKALNSSQTKEAKKYLDAMVHRRFQEADPPTLASVANNLRQVFAYILDGN